jgi:RNA polymerase sigma-70 factor (ECF subfamily)
MADGAVKPAEEPVIRVQLDPTDEAWVRAAFAAHGRELYHFATRSLGDRGLAEEAVQDTFVRAWRAADRFDESVGSLRTWLFAIIRNVIIDMTRARAVRPPLASDEPNDAPLLWGESSDEDFERVLSSWQVEEAIRRLSDDHRTALVAVHYEGRTYQEVAHQLGVPAGTVKSRVYYALKQLRLLLDELGWADG